VIVPISVWSDIACPWCFVGKAHLEDALEQLALDAQELQVQVRWRAFELDPSPRKPSTQSYAERLASKYQRSVSQAQEMIDTMTKAIADCGGRVDFTRIVPANTFDAHSHKDMLQLIESLSLDVTDAEEVLASARFGDVVRSDEAQAQHYEIRGVPFFAIAGYGLSGAQPGAVILETVRQALSDQAQ